LKMNESLLANLRKETVAVSVGYFLWTKLDVPDFCEALYPFGDSTGTMVAK
jgi:hypothetical protein